jgi:6-phosphogluconolactonase
VGLCDERWVSPLHKDSNEKLVRDTLLQGNASGATFIGMYDEKAMNTSTCSEKIKAKLYPFDVLILGMGSDGHTASLFPHNEKLEEGFDLNSDELCIAIKPETAPHNRMSLTLKAILSAKNLYLHIEGSEKLDVYEKALRGKDSFDMPIRAVLHQNIKDLEVYYA